MRLFRRITGGCTTRLIIGLLLLSWALGAPPVGAEDLPAATSTASSPESNFPGLDQVIPRASEVAAKVKAADAIINRSDVLQDIPQQLSELFGKLNALEEQYNNWEDVANWPLNRLMSAQARYRQIDLQQKQLFEGLSSHFKNLESLRETWIKEAKFWQDWHASLLTSGVSVPEDVFQKTRQTIEDLLQRISAASSALIKKQEEFAPGQQTPASRLAMIENALQGLRQETFRRNAYSLFSADFYRQFSAEMFMEYRNNILSTIRLPDGFWQRQGGIIAFQLIGIILLANILLKRRRRPKPISADWRFFFQHPVAGATFIILATTGTLYDNPGPSWGWFIQSITTIAGTVLVGAMTEKTRRRRLIWVLAAVFLISEALKTSGLPDPAYQLYVIILCTLSVPLCLLIARYRRRQEPDRIGVHVISLYLISLTALIGLITALMGFATLSSHLIDAVLGTIIILLIVRMAIHLVDGGITEFLRLNWIRDRKLVRRLGISAGDRLKTLARVIILVNAALFLPVVWDLFNSVDEETSLLFSIEYTIGDFSISVYSVTTIILVLYLTGLLSWLLQAMADAYIMTPRRMDFGVKTAMKRLLHYGLFTIGFLVAVSMAGLDLKSFAIIAGALGVGIGFGLQNIVNNFVSGLVLLFERPVKVGDTINIDQQWGTINKIGLRSTVVETLDRSEIIVPNSDLISQKVTNWTLSSNISRVILTVGVAYGSNLTRVLSILDTVGKEHPDVLSEPAPNAIFTGFGDSSIDFELRVWISDISKRLKVRSELGQAVDAHFREAGVSIPFPQRDLHLRSIETNLQSMLGVTPENQRPGPEGNTE
ncbi:MAG: mechanosensitive ion channel family protein [Desulfuromonadales bacterium]